MLSATSPKEYERVGIPISRSTLNALFHRAGDLLAPLVERLFVEIAQSELVLADETSMRMQRVEKKAFIWAFLSGGLIGYRFGCDQSSDAPKGTLGDTAGILVRDGYTQIRQADVDRAQVMRRLPCSRPTKDLRRRGASEAAAALELIGRFARSNVTRSRPASRHAAAR